MASLQFPGRVVKKGDPDEAVVKAVQRTLNARGCGPVHPDGDFGTQTEAAVKLFQARFTDVEGAPLVVDGKVGSISWAAPLPWVRDRPEPGSIHARGEQRWRLVRLRAFGIM